MTVLSRPRLQLHRKLFNLPIWSELFSKIHSFPLKCCTCIWIEEWIKVVQLKQTILKVGSLTGFLLNTVACQCEAYNKEWHWPLEEHVEVGQHVAAAGSWPHPQRYLACFTARLHATSQKCSDMNHLLTVISSPVKVQNHWGNFSRLLHPRMSRPFACQLSRADCVTPEDVIA